MNTPGLELKETTELFDKYRMEVTDLLKDGRVTEKMILDKVNKKDDKPFSVNFGMVYNFVGTEAGRKWCPIKGNLSGFICIPIKMFRTEMEEKTWPALVSYVTYEYFLKYGPGQFYLKYFNDIVCKEGKKVSGILFRRVLGWAYAALGCNIVGHPPKKDLREKGLEACHLLEHTTAKVEAYEFFNEIAEDVIRKTIKGFDWEHYCDKFIYDINRNPFSVVQMFKNAKAKYPEMKSLFQTPKVDGFYFTYPFGLKEPMFDFDDNLYNDGYFDNDAMPKDDPVFNKDISACNLEETGIYQDTDEYKAEKEKAKKEKEEKEKKEKEEKKEEKKDEKKDEKKE